MSDPSPDQCPDDSKAEVARLFDVWNEALKSQDAARVTALYAPDAILLPTVSNAVRHNHKEIQDYFVDFLKKAPVGRILESNIMVMDNVAVHSGLYCFDLTDCGECYTVPARFSFVYRKTEGEWVIVEHHSSHMPHAETV